VRRVRTADPVPKRSREMQNDAWSLGNYCWLPTDRFNVEPSSPQLNRDLSEYNCFWHAGRNGALAADQYRTLTEHVTIRTVPPAALIGT